MRALLRRLAWLFARLVLLSLLCFALVSRLATRHPTPTVELSDRYGEANLPRFINWPPRDLHTRVAEQLTKLAQGESPGAERELARLGGAALGSVSDALRMASPETAHRLCRAMLPVLTRMGELDPTDTLPSNQACGQLIRSWEEHSRDFRPVVARRWVQRLGEQALASRRSEVATLDTFALGELIAAMPRVRDTKTQAQARRLTAAAAGAAGLPWVIRDGTPLDTADGLVLRWKRWWTLHQLEYSELRGPKRLAAVVTETQYGHWVATVFTPGLGVDLTGQPIASSLLSALPPSLVVLLGGLLGAWGAAATLTWLRSRLKLERLGGWSGRIIGSIPPVALAAWLAPPNDSAARLLLATVVVGATVALGATSVLASGSHLALFRAGTNPRHHLAQDLRRLLAGFSTALGPDWPWLMTTLILVEHAFGLRGLGAWTVAAVARGDVAALMALTLGCLLTLMLLELALDREQSPVPGTEPRSPS